MATPNPRFVEQLLQAREQLAKLKAEKARLFPPNLHPFTEPDKFPSQYTAEQVQYRNQLITQIENLEQRIQELEDNLYRK